MKPEEYFVKPRTVLQKQYCALAAYFKDNLPAKEAARRYGYTIPALYSLAQTFRQRIRKDGADPFFRDSTPGRKPAINTTSIENLILCLRKKNFSNFNILEALEAMGIKTSQPQIWRILNKHGFSKLARRTKEDRVKAKKICQTLNRDLPCPGQETKEEQDANPKDGI